MKKALLPFLLCLAGCAVGPNYVEPEHNQSTWSTPLASEAEIAHTRQVWWAYLGDTQLDDYLEQAVFHNYNLQAAAANILQARGSKRIAAASYYPQIDADAVAARIGPSKNGQFIEVPQAAGITQALKTQSLFAAFFDCVWEVDLFGKTKRGVEAAMARVESAIEERNNLLITIQAEVAKNYIDIRGTQEKIRLTEENILLLRHKSALVKKRLTQGLDATLQYEEILASLATYEAKLPHYFSELYSSAFSLSVLLGKTPEALLEELLEQKPLPQPPEHILIGARSELLRNRPDVRKAERELAAATADVGVAIANLFPSFTFAGLLGLDSNAIHNLFTWHSKAWALGGNLGAPLFHGGALRGNVQKKRADLEKAQSEYTQAVLNALQEAETTLTSFLQALKSQNLLHNTVLHQKQVTDLKEKRYTLGLDSELKLLDAQRELVTTKLNLTDNQITTLTNFIALYKALGGAWDAQENHN